MHPTVTHTHWGRALDDSSPPPVAYATEQVNSRLAKPPVNFNGGLAKFGLIYFVKNGPLECDHRTLKTMGFCGVLKVGKFKKVHNECMENM